eukprot:gene8401-7700_t
MFVTRAAASLALCAVVAEVRTGGVASMTRGAVVLPFALGKAHVTVDRATGEYSVDSQDEAGPTPLKGGPYTAWLGGCRMSSAHSAAPGRLRLAGSNEDGGHDAVGAFARVSLVWEGECGSSPVRWVTAFKAYANGPLVFVQ